MNSFKAPKIKLSSYDVTTTLGTGTFSNLIKGSFGRVKLAKNKETSEYHALKMLKKAEIVRLKQVDHIISENVILSNIDHPFLVESFDLE